MPTYEFYVSTYMGNQIAEQDFPRLITRAGVYLEKFNCTDESKLNMAMCAVAEAWQTNEQGGELASQSVGGWSKSYQQTKPKTNEQRLLDAVKMYLGNCISARWC